jgi:flagellar assembly factor FliW
MHPPGTGSRRHDFGLSEEGPKQEWSSREAKESVLKITTRQNTVIEVDEKAIITFPEGLVGFEEYKRYALYSIADEEPFHRIQYLEAEEIGFVVIDPLLVMPDYDFEVDDETIELLKIDRPESLQLFAIVTVSSDYSRMTANLLAPILVNRDTSMARQIVLQDTAYTTRHNIFAGGDETDEAQKEAENG